MICDPKRGCPSNTHNLHCGYPNCEKGKAEKAEAAKVAPQRDAREVDVEKGCIASRCPFLHVKPMEKYPEMIDDVECTAPHLGRVEPSTPAPSTCPLRHAGAIVLHVRRKS